MSKCYEFIKKYDIFIFVILGIIFYFPALFYDFVYDDIPYIVHNEYLNGLKNINLFQFFIPKFVLDAVYTPFALCWMLFIPHLHLLFIG